MSRVGSTNLHPGAKMYFPYDPVFLPISRRIDGPKSHHGIGLVRANPRILKGHTQNRYPDASCREHIPTSTFPLDPVAVFHPDPDL